MSTLEKLLMEINELEIIADDPTSSREIADFAESRINVLLVKLEAITKGDRSKVKRGETDE